MDLNEQFQKLLLENLDKQKEIPSVSQFIQDSKLEIDQNNLVGVLKSLAARSVISYDCQDREQWILTEEGLEVAQKGSHEMRLFNAIKPDSDGSSVEELQGLLGVFYKVAQNVAFKNHWVAKKGDNFLVRSVTTIPPDDIQQQLLLLQQQQQQQDPSSLNEESLKELKKRKLIEKSKKSLYAVKKGPSFTLNVQKPATDMTAEMIQSGSWRTLQFKEYNLINNGTPIQCGSLHPLMKVREEFRKIFLEMGFCEMATNNYVESSFWNFDALFQPQQHPSREVQDTFFLLNPKTARCYPKDYMERVKEMHSTGGHGSIGYRYEWKEEEGMKNILRTHTTAVSTWHLYKLASEAKNNSFQPAKYFSIDKVFRNESLDATHLAEFHQIEGLIADYNLTLGDLIGFMKAFYGKLGIKQLRFKPAYNPYTEPSMEIFGYHEGLGKWIEIGNSGIFRPEMLEPMGFDSNVTVIAWGLSLERPTMIKYGIPNIRDLVGHKVNLQFVQNSPICRLDK